MNHTTNVSFTICSGNGREKVYIPSPRLSFSLSWVPPNSSSWLETTLKKSSSESIVVSGGVVAFTGGVVGDVDLVYINDLICFFRTAGSSARSLAFLFWEGGGVVNDGMKLGA